MHRFREAYQSELTYLRELGSEFARTNPSLMRGFAVEGGDPDVERLLEGFAFLSAKIRQRSEDALPELCEALTDVLLPHYLRPLPATSILQFAPKKGALRNAHRIPPGTTVAANPLEGTQCVFRTSSAVDLLPVELERCMLDESAQNAPLLRLIFSAPDHARRIIVQQPSLRLFLHGALPLCSTLALWFSRHVESIRWFSQRPNMVASSQPVPNDALRLVFENQAFENELTDDALKLWPWPDAASMGPRLLQEFFTQPSRSLFVDLMNLKTLDPDSHDDRFELQIRFRNPPAIKEQLPEQTFRLHCVPVANLFDCSADPIRKDLVQEAQLIRGGGLPFQHVEVYSVNEVTGTRSQGGGRVIYRPLSAFAQMQDPKESTGAVSNDFYSLVRRESPIDGGMDTYLRLGRPSDIRKDLREEVISLELTCTNRLLPASLRTGDICQSTPDSPGMATFSNITAVSKPVPPPLGSELYWRLLSHLSAHPRSLGQTRRLRNMLSLYNFQQGVDVQSGRLNAQRIEAIRSVAVSPAQRLLRGVPVNGIAVNLELDEGGFASHGDAYLFGCALYSFLREYTTINSFLTMSAELHPSTATLAWEAGWGSKILI